jgi:molecular chaperone DnaK
MDGIEKATAELNTVWQAASEEMYKASQASAGQPGEPQPGAPEPDQGDKKGDDEVTDVDFEEVK